MSYILLGAAVLLLIGCRPFLRDFHDDYISRDQTQCINGFFVLLVFMRHFEQYIKPAEPDMLYICFSRNMNQLIVVPFLFYSGYGIMLSVQKKGSGYVCSIMTKRFPRLLIHFMLAVTLFWITGICMNRFPPIEKVLLSMIGWDGLGNSNWYIFDTLILYIFTFIGCIIFRKKPWAAVTSILLLTIGFMVVMSMFKPRYWYNTCIAYPLGIAFALVDKSWLALCKKRLYMYGVLWLGAAVLLTCGYLTKKNIFGFEVLVIGFILMMLAVTMKLKTGNPVLRFLGKYVFEIYILQRIPMLIFKGVLPDNYLYMGICFAITIAAAVLFRLLTDRLDTIPSLLMKKLS